MDTTSDARVGEDFQDYSPRPHVRLLVARHHFAAVSQALLNPEQCDGQSVGGRGNIYLFPLSDGKFGVVRECFRGGLVRLMMRRHYLFLNRPLREFLRHREIERIGVPAPPLLGVCWRRTGCLYSGLIATERITGRTVTAALSQTSDFNEMCHILCACGKAIRAMHDKGVWHADLQLKNVMIADDGPVFLDFDRARIYSSLPDRRRWNNLFRLRRSLLKHGFPIRLFESILEGYGSLRPNRLLDGWYSLKGMCSDIVQIMGR